MKKSLRESFYDYSETPHIIDENILTVMDPILTHKLILLCDESNRWATTDKDFNNVICPNCKEFIEKEYKIKSVKLRNHMSFTEKTIELFDLKNIV